MASSFVLLVVALTIVAACQPAQNLADGPSDISDCATQFSQCEHELHDLRKQRERAKETDNMLGNQLWNLAHGKQHLVNEIKILRHQVEHPDAPVPHVGERGTGPGLVSYRNDVDLVTTNCTSNLVLCEKSKVYERNRIQDFERSCEVQRSQIAEQLRIHDELRATAAALKSQLAERNVTPHPSSQHRDFSLGISAELDIDSTEIERRVNASIDRRDTRS